MTAGKSAWYGWVTFAAVMLAILGTFNVIGGLVGLLANEVAYIDQGDLVVVDLTAWSIVAIVFGGLLIFAGLGLLTHNTAARIAAIVLVGLHALVQLTALGAYPVWSILMIALDVVILFALTARWSEVAAGAPEEAYNDAYIANRSGQHRYDRPSPASPASSAPTAPTSAVPGPA
jgi:hypothetical protein